MGSNRSADQRRCEELKRTVQAFKSLLQCNEIDPVTKSQAEGKIRALEMELANLHAYKKKLRNAPSPIASD
jgi:hypothetical protein